MDHQHPPAPEPVKIPEYVSMPDHVYYDLKENAQPFVPATNADRVNRAAQTTLLFAGFGGLVVVSAWTYGKVVNFIEEQKFQREMRAKRLDEPVSHP